MIGSSAMLRRCGSSARLLSASFLYHPQRRLRRQPTAILVQRCCDTILTTKRSATTGTSSWNDNNLPIRKDGISTKCYNYTPIIIVGGGPSGLLLSILLGQYSIDHILLEAQTPQQRFQHPQAHFLNTRTMEILKHCSINTNNSSISLYDKIRTAMPPVQEWEKFRFGYSMNDPIPLAEVLHAVDQPLQVNTDANGRLIKDDDDAKDRSEIYEPKNGDLSPCSVGHLAQHTFCQILYDEAVLHHPNLRMNNGDNNNQSGIYFDTKVIDIQYNQKDDLMNVTTEDGTIWTTSLVVAADGANSRVRSEYCQGKIYWLGQEGIQYLMNVHVQLTAEQAEELHRNNRHAMLYSVFNEQVVAMVVCHSRGEYIIQIPYFPPYQTMEYDFTLEKVQHLVQTIFFGSTDHHHSANTRISQQQIVSIRSWTMSSMLADQYFVMLGNSKDSNTTTSKCGIVLVGDAAHVFPPAGGFGMNTGIQDVHNLAWKLAKWVYCNKNSKNDESGHPKVEEHNRIALYDVLESYQKERRPIAQENAALSVRNYNRLLDVTKSMYLNNQHPALLIQILNNSPLLPLHMKQSIFRTMLQTALLPLRNLKPSVTSTTHNPLSNLYVKHIRNNLRKILESGAGLPLLFPKYEIGYVYGPASAATKSKRQQQQKESQNNTNGIRRDTWAYAPELVVGGLLPHVMVEVVVNSGKELSHYPNLKLLMLKKPSGANHKKGDVAVKSSTSHFVISTRDLASQMVTTNRKSGETKPVYTILHVMGGRKTLHDHLHHGNDATISVNKELSYKLGLPVKYVYLVAVDDDNDDIDLHAVNDYNHDYVDGVVQDSSICREDERIYLQQVPKRKQAFSFHSSFPASSFVVLIRPDGHIEAIERDAGDLLKT